MLNKQLTIRFDAEMREKLEIIANREFRPMANQVIHFVALGIEKYLKDNDLYFEATNDGLTLKPFPPEFVPPETL